MNAEYFHPKTTPDVPVRVAVRMSMAIPGNNNHDGNYSEKSSNSIIIFEPSNIFIRHINANYHSYFYLSTYFILHGLKWYGSIP